IAQLLPSGTGGAMRSRTVTLVKFLCARLRAVERPKTPAPTMTMASSFESAVMVVDEVILGSCIPVGGVAYFALLSVPCKGVSTDSLHPTSLSVISSASGEREKDQAGRSEPVT